MRYFFYSGSEGAVYQIRKGKAKRIVYSLAILLKPNGGYLSTEGIFLYINQEDHFLRISFEDGGVEIEEINTDDETGILDFCLPDHNTLLFLTGKGNIVTINLKSKKVTPNNLFFEKNVKASYLSICPQGRNIIVSSTYDGQICGDNRQRSLYWLIY